MVECGFKSGIFFWKKPCAEVPLGSCSRCGRGACSGHGVQRGDGAVYCMACAEAHPIDFGNFAVGGTAAAATASSAFAATAASLDVKQGAPGTLHSPGSSDSGRSSST
jgi:hypothetical protein